MRARQVALALAAGLLSACAPPTPDHESWSDSALQALDDAHSEVATVRLLLRQSREDLVTRSYEKVVVLDSEEAAGLVAESFGAKQPPPGDDQEYAAVTTALSDAADLLTDVRIAVERDEVASYPGLARKVVQALSDLEAAEEEVAR